MQKEDFQKGEVVKILGGEFAGKEGKILEVSSKAVKIQIGSLNVQIPKEDLRDELPDLEKIEVTAMTDEEKAKVEAEYLRRRTFAEGAGEKLAIINREIAEIEANPEKLALTPTLKKRLADLKAIQAKLLVGDEGVRKHTEFATLMAAIRQADPHNAGKYVAEATNTGRIRLTERNSGSNLLFWANRIYEPAPDSTGKVTPATLGLIAELRKLTDTAKQQRRDEYKEAVTTIKAKATKGLILSRIVAETPVPVGVAYGYLPYREEKRGDQIFRQTESHFLVECDGKVIKPVEAAGRLRQFFAELVEKNRFVTVGDLRNGKLGTFIKDQATFKELAGFLGMLRATVEEEKKVKTAPKPAPATKPTAEQPTKPPARTKKSATRKTKTTKA